MGETDLPEEQAVRVRKALEKLYRERFNENKSALGRAMGKSRVAVGYLLSGKNSPSNKTAEKVAELAGYADVRDLLLEPVRSVGAQTQPSRPRRPPKT